MRTLLIGSAIVVASWGTTIPAREAPQAPPKTGANADKLQGDGAQALWREGQAARRGLAGQIDAWNRGDLEGALAAYWNSPRMTWVSKSGVNYGFSAFAQAMRKDFADPETMGTYSADVLDARDFGRGAQQITFRWKIERDGKRLLGGLSTQVWGKVDGEWHAIFEHAS